MSTLTHRPHARYITTDRFLLSHILASIGGAGFGMIGLASRLSLVALGTAVLGNTLVTAGTASVGGLLFTIVGFLFVDVLQPVGGLLMAGAPTGMVMRPRLPAEDTA